MVSVAVVGVGAVGGVMAARLALAGAAEVTVCVRSPLGGLRLQLPDGSTQTVPDRGLNELSDATRATTSDWVLLATKAHQTTGAAQWLHRLCGPATRVAVLQNGVEHHERVAPLVGNARILPTVVAISAEPLRRGHIQLFNEPRIVVPDNADGHAFENLCAGSGVAVDRTDDFLTASWAKLCLNVANGAVTALTQQRIPVFRNPNIARLGRALVEEARLVGTAAGAHLPEDLADQVLARLQAMPPEAGSSMLWDRIAGRPLEHDARNGAVVRVGARFGIPAPYNETVTALLDAVSGSQQDVAGSGQRPDPGRNEVEDNAPEHGHRGDDTEADEVGLRRRFVR
ncbi:2-dehydropantoate 2-reductase [Streptomyces sp. NPDC002889]|uniref:2-dehydropantoate 2-reductase n=1 Tax=Streptomyces sp. NPDC002889 TaxID=3364669 RepID=UPI00367F431A